MGEEKSLLHFLHQQADSLSWFKVRSPILFLWCYVWALGGGRRRWVSFFSPLTSVFSHGFLKVSLVQQMEEEEYIP